MLVCSLFFSNKQTTKGLLKLLRTLIKTTQFITLIFLCLSTFESIENQLLHNKIAKKKRE